MSHIEVSKINNSNKQQAYCRLEAISARYDIPLSTLRRWASERRFPLYKISNLVRVSPVEFQEWWDKRHIT